MLKCNASCSAWETVYSTNSWTHTRFTSCLCLHSAGSFVEVWCQAGPVSAIMRLDWLLFWIVELFSTSTNTTWAKQRNHYAVWQCMISLHLKWMSSVSVEASNTNVWEFHYWFRYFFMLLKIHTSTRNVPSVLSQQSNEPLPWGD